MYERSPATSETKHIFSWSHDPRRPTTHRANPPDQIDRGISRALQLLIPCTFLRVRLPCVYVVSIGHRGCNEEDGVVEVDGEDTGVIDIQKF